MAMIMTSSNVGPALLLRPVSNHYVVPALLPGRQQVDDVVAEVGEAAATCPQCAIMAVACALVMVPLGD